MNYIWYSIKWVSLRFRSFRTFAHIIYHCAVISTFFISIVYKRLIFILSGPRILFKRYQRRSLWNSKNIIYTMLSLLDRVISSFNFCFTWSWIFIWFGSIWSFLRSNSWNWLRSYVFIFCNIVRTIIWKLTLVLEYWDL